ncbi:MAG: DUF445 domain-containing protein [Acetobacteraceae bacterium]|nr:DUF445 domain-containing protein [Acetobacteraceae bacterium]
MSDTIAHREDEIQRREEADRRALRRHRAWATRLLVLMAVLTIGSYALPGGYATDLLQAAAKAGFVGGIADWFAVTALFRHPLGIPIPHTAIIPNQKARLGQALGRFVATHVLSRDEIARVLEQLDVPAILRRFLADPVATRPAAEALAQILPRLLATVEDGRARRLVGRIVPRILGGPAAGKIVARALRELIESGRHQEVLTFLLSELRTVLAGRENALRHAIEERVREQGGRLVGWVLGATVARRVLAVVNNELEKIGPASSELRAAFDEWARREITRMEEDPERAAAIGAALRRVVAHETVQAWLRDIWARLRMALEADAGRVNGRTVTYLEGVLANLGGLLEADPAARAGVQRTAAGVVSTILLAVQGQIEGVIGKIVAGWDTATIIDRIELRVGKDLQFVRINGTLVGFLVGGILYALLRATFG